MPASPSPRAAACLALALALAACGSGGSEGAAVPGDRADTRPYAGVAADDRLRFTGTEPFWGGEVIGDRLTWRTPEQPDGRTIAVARFNGRGGFSYSGTLDGAAFTLAIAPGDCSDGMSDRVYPFAVALQLDEALREGCAWSDAHPFRGEREP